MNKEEIFSLMNSNPGFFLATVEGAEPRVRGMLLYRADASGILFHSGTTKDFYGRVMKNPTAEMCFNDFNRNIQVSVSGQLGTVDDNNVKDEISEHPTRQFLKSWKESGELLDFYNSFIVFRLRNGVATTWTIEKNFAPKDSIQL